MDLQRILKNLVNTVMQSNAEIASEQEKAIVASTGSVKSQLESLNTVADETGATIAELREAVVRQTLDDK
jgi:hypothetical protein